MFQVTAAASDEQKEAEATNLAEGMASTERFNRCKA